ncbi:MAG: glycosyltransferase family 2 protein [Polyangiaceae bacterium]|jgi:dolichyl-phosphate beta-glucosyltransferase|nr:glycosyltransferase family 2 protein [Polyangiaceae bacterium]
MSGLALSVVIPAFNEEARLEPTLRRVVQHLVQSGLDHEVIVVDDGSTDETAALTRRVAADCQVIRLIELGENRGKGAAVRAGVLAARGREILFSDADMATPIEELAKLRAALAAGNDIAIGSRAVRGADIRVRQHRARELMGRTFNLLVQILALRGIRDTQCGFKLFPQAVARDLFARATVDGFAFDVELLVLAKRRYRVAEVPVAWSHVEESKVSPGADAARMLVDLVRLRLRHWRS